ncbi:flagellar filament capping protein FliD [Methylocucumis oryzae]|uniref:Flagellar hook-associated protein 2 C-terminal domain-containing protein n=1 Tax=Methylocucumis oryzae TaxID=1632867 RepID=A0A0F3IK42_9GAMM|nr:flagellar filament capping protein FliD [Methylocucumis oryzae]KJV05949.1 hypothetical protein VZ94_14520 [Methylocucumis oryzae]
MTATGKGQFLTASSGDASGLKLLVDGTTLGDRGTVTFSRSILDKLSATIDSLLSTNGSLNSRTSGLQNDLSEVAKAKTALNERMEKYQQRLLAQFNAMDQLIGSMQATSSFLTQQITAYNNANSNN